MVRVFVGDVQGCLHELEQLLALLKLDAQRDQLFFVGDLVNKGPDSAGVLRLARDLDAQCVLGNHEAKLIARGGFEPEAPSDALRRCPDLLRAPDRVELGAWVKSWPLMRDLGDVWLVHAAVPPALWQAHTFRTPTTSEREFCIVARYCDAAGQRPPTDWPEPKAPFRPWHEFYSGSATVVFGHWARQGLLVRDRLRGLDTGCVYGKELTAWVAETDEIVQVAAKTRS